MPKTTQISKSVNPKIQAFTTLNPGRENVKAAWAPI